MLEKLNLKKGAMFGLDARVALAIIGTLVVISSFYAYSIVRDAKVGAIIFDGKEIVKAIESYEYDINNELGNFAATEKLELSKLLSDSDTKWKGPYISTVNIGIDNSRLVSPNLGSFYVFKAKGREATDVTDDPFIACVSGQTCYLWMIYDDSAFSSVINNMAQKLDEQLDSLDGFLTGKIQKWNNALMYRLQQIDF